VSEPLLTCALLVLDPQLNPKEMKTPALHNWNRNMSLETVLVALRKEMAEPTNRKTPQPAEGSEY
jgi:ubiquitin-protein ligase